MPGTDQIMMLILPYARVAPLHATDQGRTNKSQVFVFLVYLWGSKFSDVNVVESLIAPLLLRRGDIHEAIQERQSLRRATASRCDR